MVVALTPPRKVSKPPRTTRASNCTSASDAPTVGGHYDPPLAPLASSGWPGWWEAEASVRWPPTITYRPNFRTKILLVSTASRRRAWPDQASRRQARLQVVAAHDFASASPIAGSSRTDSD